MLNPNPTTGINTPLLNTPGATINRSTVNGSFVYLIENLSTTFSTCPSDLRIKGDVWASQQPNADKVHCYNANLNFLPPQNDLTVTGSLQCGFKDGYPDNKFSVNMVSLNPTVSALSVDYDVYVDNGDGSFSTLSDTKVGYRHVDDILVHSGSPYTGGLFDYITYSNLYAYQGRALWIYATAASGAGTFTREVKIVNGCTNPPPTPTANPDYFKFGVGSWTGNLSDPLKANLYGGYLKWQNDPLAANNPAYSLNTEPAVSGGIDGDNTDAPLSVITFTLESGLKIENAPACQMAIPNPGSLVWNTKGFFDYTAGDACVNVVSFTYSITNTITGLSTGPITVIIEINDPVILPVTYASFTVTRTSNSQVVLAWETAMEENNKGFHVQRNVNGEWKNIGFVFTQAERGNSSNNLKYGFKDANSSKGISQYRILQVDMDGKGRYSEVRAIRGEEMAARLTVFPNPSNTGSFSILFEDAASLRDVVVSDVSGRAIKQYKGVSNSSLTIENLGAGFYTVQVLNRTTGAMATEKVIIKKR